MVKQEEDIMKPNLHNHLLSTQSIQNFQDPNLLPFLIQNSNDPNTMNIIKTIINNNNLNGMLQMNDEIYYKKSTDNDEDDINSLRDEPFSKRLRMDEREFENEGKLFDVF
jgi:hypothetical protein